MSAALWDGRGNKESCGPCGPPSAESLSAAPAGRSSSSCGPCGPPGPGWPPTWLSGAAGMADSGSQAEGPGGGTTAPVVPASVMRAAPASASHSAAACPALEAELRAIEAEVARRTADPRLRQAARNLLDDCREALLAGQVESAQASARHLARSIPAFLTARGL